MDVIAAVSVSVYGDLAWCPLTADAVQIQKVSIELTPNEFLPIEQASATAEIS